MYQEYMLSMEEIKQKMPINKIMDFDGKAYRVVGYSDEVPSTAFASFPRVNFEEVDTTEHDRIIRADERAKAVKEFKTLTLNTGFLLPNNDYCWQHCTEVDMCGECKRLSNGNIDFFDDTFDEED